jgi:DNA gyrase subunit B
MDPEQRKMFKVSIDDAERADQVFKTLMWPDVAPRRRFIQTRAKDVEDLDV